MPHHWRIFRPEQTPRSSLLPVWLFLAHNLSVLIAFQWSVSENGIAVFWPGNGILAGALLLLPRRRALGVVAAAISTQVLLGLASSLKLETLLIGAVCDVGEAALIALLVRQYGGAALDILPIRRFRDLAGRAIAPSAIIMGVIGSMAVWGGGGGRLGDLVLHWTLGHFLGAMISLPAVLLLSRPAVGKVGERADRTSRTLSSLLLLVIATFTAAVFLQPSGEVLFLIFPLMMLAAFKLSPKSMVSALGIVAVIAGTATIYGLGPIAKANVASHELRDLNLQLFLATIVFSKLVTSGVITRWRKSDARMSTAVNAARRSATLATQSLDELAHEQGASREQQAFMTSIVEVLPTPLMVKDAADGRYVLVNSAAEYLLGIPAAELIGRNAQELFSPEEAEKFSVEDRTIVELGGTFIDPLERVVTPERGERYFSTKKVAIPMPGGATYIVAVAEDVTEEHKSSAELQTALAAAELASVAKSAFLANMSHEIRTPLNGVIAVVDALGRTDLDPRQREMADIIRHSGRGLLQLLSDVLDLSKADSGSLEISDQAFDLATTTHDLTALARAWAAEKDVAFELEQNFEDPFWVRGDEMRIKQILGNLISNAVKFTEQGQINLSVSADGGSLRITVRDTGIGFDLDAKQRLFDRFQQADNSITRKYGGSGLGLTISAQLARLMNGELDCDSTPGRGSVFWLTLPLRRAEAPSNTATAARQELEREILRILAADDHPVNRRVVELILESTGAYLVSVEDGAAAVAAFERETFDIVLMDMQMPVMDGLAATRAIRDQERATGARPVPVVMLTANVAQEHIDASIAAGADMHLGKPVSAEGLLEVVAELTTRQVG